MIDVKKDPDAVEILAEEIVMPRTAPFHQTGRTLQRVLRASLVGLLLFSLSCSAATKPKLGAPETAEFPRPAKVDRAHIGPDYPDEPPSKWAALLFIPALFFAGASVPDDVLSGAPPTMLLSGMLKKRQWEHVKDDWLPREEEEALARAFSGATPRVDPLSTDRPRPVSAPDPPKTSTLEDPEEEDEIEN